MGEQNGVGLEELVEVWDRAEAATGEIIRQVQPTVVSEERRRDVVDYVQRLLKGCLGCEVFPFGSVPLKTYLPDGDIDLTAFCGFNFEEAFANEVYSVLEVEEHNPGAKFVVKDVQYIRAEVKLVKCLVQNIVVDISFNQIGGLCALGFLEEIDRLIGKDHLFKRSIILIKAWCYYESRILGAHHGLISTYALETLVLYIFHLFHSSLDGPLAVLHKFLDYFSQFDWDNLCVSLSGPIRVNSLPEVVVETPEINGGELLLSDDFMKECARKFSVPSRVGETNYKSFTQKHLNIVDPLKENNNLGRSVSKGNFFRIRSAFSYGARKLGHILFQSSENVPGEVRKFFANTLDRHGNGQRPDVQDHLQLSACNGFNSEMSFLYDGAYQDQINAFEQDSLFSNNQLGESRLGFENPNHVVVSNFREAGTNIEASGSRLSGDENELVTSDIQDLRITEQGDEFHPLLEGKNLPSHRDFSHPLENGKLENGHLASNGFVSWEENSRGLCNGNDHLSSEDSTSHHEVVNLLPDLSGDVDIHLDNLHYGRWLYDQGLAMPIQQPVHIVPPMLQPNVSWEPMHQTVQLRQDGGPQMNVNGAIPRPPFFPTNPSPRGLGTYFPIVLQNHHSYRDRSSPKGRYQGQLKSPRTNGRGPMPFDGNLQAQGPVRQGNVRPKYSDYWETSPRRIVYKETNGFAQAREKTFEYDPPREAETCKPSDLDPFPESPNVEPIFVVDESRLSVNSYRLKDEEDFPPLCA